MRSSSSLVSVSMACNRVISSFGRGFCVWFLCVSSLISSSIVGLGRRVFLFSQVLVSSCTSSSIFLNLCLQSGFVSSSFLTNFFLQFGFSSDSRRLVFAWRVGEEVICSSSRHLLGDISFLGGLSMATIGIVVSFFFRWFFTSYSFI